MKAVYSDEDCRTFIWVVELALAEAGVISREECERVLDDDDEENYKKLEKADKSLAKRLEKAFGNLEANDEDLGDALVNCVLPKDSKKAKKETKGDCR